MTISYSKLFVGISLPALCTGLAGLILCSSAHAQTIRPSTQKELKVFDPTASATGNVGIRAAAGTVSYTLTLPAAAPLVNQVLSVNAVSVGSVSLTWATPASGTVTSVGLAAPTGFAVSSSPVTSAGTLSLSYASGYSLPTTTSQTNWDGAYNDRITAASVTGTTTKTITLSQQDGGTVTATFSDLNTDAVSSVFGRIGAVTSTTGDYTTAQVTESGNLYYTDARARAALSITTTGTSGAATYSSTTGSLNIPQYQAVLTNPVTGTGTTNYLSKFASAGTLTNSLLFDDGTNVGIGSISPTARLEVRGAGTTSATTALEVDNSGGTSLLTVRDDGNVGIGTSPISRLHLVDEIGYTADNTATQLSSNLLIQSAYGDRTPGTGAAIGFIIPANTNGTNLYSQGRILVTPDNTNNANASGRMYLQTRYFNGSVWAYRDNLVLASSGNVGIGTTSPERNFVVSSSIPKMGFNDTGVTFSSDQLAAFGNKQNEIGELGAASSSNGALYLKGVGTATNSNSLGTLYDAFVEIDPTTYSAHYFNVAKRSITTLTTIGNTGAIFKIANNYTPLFTVLGNGNVGIGTTSPNNLLSVAGTLTKSLTDGTGWGLMVEDTKSQAAGVGGGIIFRGYKIAQSNSANFGAIAGIKENGTSGNELGALAFYVNVGGSGALEEKMRINSSGQIATPLGSVGAPSYSFVGDLNTGIYSSGADAIGLVTGGVARLTANSVGEVIVTRNFKVEEAGLSNAIGGNFDGTSVLTVYAGTSSMTALKLRAAASQTAAIMQWANSGNTVLGVINSGGNVLIGKTSSSFSTNGIELNTNGSGCFWTGSNATLLTMNRIGTNDHLILFKNDGTDCGAITIAGTNTTNFNTTSDYRLKEDLKDFNGLALVSKIPVYDFQWKRDSTRSYGVMAHELQSVLPYAVSGTKDGENTQGVDYSKIVPLLVKAIQEQQVQLGQLKAEQTTTSSLLRQLQLDLQTIRKKNAVHKE
jgi:hypothetical protein